MAEITKNVQTFVDVIGIIGLVLGVITLIGFLIKLFLGI